MLTSVGCPSLPITDRSHLGVTFIDLRAGRAELAPQMNFHFPSRLLQLGDSIMLTL